MYYAWEFYDDVDAVYLADGSIVFASTRRISKAHSLQITRGFNLYRVFPDAGGAPERLTHFVRFSARYPVTLPDGRILFSRWWNQFSFKIREATDEWDLAVMHSDGSDVRRFVNTSGGVHAEFDHSLDQFGIGYELMNANMATVLAQGGQINRVASIQMHHGSRH